MSMDDKKYMSRAVQLARKGLGNVSPNPMVGCVIVKQGMVVGEGWHRAYGGPHAEVNAVNSVRNIKDMEGSTVYVNLEPCAHFGKTPPCADLLAGLKPGRVVIANVDTNPRVGGKGVSKLVDAGIEVETGVLEAEARKLNVRFFSMIEKKRPYIILKWARTADNFMARSDFDSKWISNQYSRKMVHRWRAEEDAILVGYNTAKYDDPLLTVRDWSGTHPKRFVVDPQGQLSRGLKLFNNEAPTITLSTSDPKEILDKAHEQKCASIIIEGGAATINSFLRSELWDEARVFTSQTTFGKGIESPMIGLASSRREQIFEDALDYYFNPNG